MSHLKRASALAATLILMMLFTGVALAESACIMSDTTVYAAPDTSSKSYGTWPAGTMLELKAEKSGWAQVERNGYIGYVKASDISEVKTYKGKTVYIEKDAEILEHFDRSSVAARVSKGDSVKLYAIAGDWALVKAGSKGGYIKLSVLTNDEPAKAPAQTMDVYVGKKTAKVYKSPSTSAKVIYEYEINDKVTIDAVQDGWCRVLRNGYTGFMRKADLSEAKTDVPVADRFTAYAVKDGVKVYETFSTSADVIMTVSLNTAVNVTAYTDDWCQVVSGSRTAYIRRSDLSSSKIEEKTEETGDGGSSATPARGKAKDADWWTSDIRSVFSVGTVATITDVETGISWKEKRMGGTNHADTQPLTAADTAAMKSAYGGTWSWDRRAVFVTINGVNYAASINGMPHGSGSIAGNDFNGHHCIHFTNSRTHGGNSVCSLHQSAVQKALNASL
ncbi:MAG: SH3 domain-containing protein [Christensenellales bacterium]|jgi:SH3-like domain-containing protein